MYVHYILCSHVHAVYVNRKFKEDAGDIEYERIKANSTIRMPSPSKFAKPTKKAVKYGKETFVSSHYRVDEAAIVDYLSRKKFVCKKIGTINFYLYSQLIGAR
jgi:hypothetical protein